MPHQNITCECPIPLESRPYHGQWQCRLCDGVIGGPVPKRYVRPGFQSRQDVRQIILRELNADPSASNAALRFIVAEGGPIRFSDRHFFGLVREVRSQLGIKSTRGRRSFDDMACVNMAEDIFRADPTLSGPQVYAELVKRYAPDQPPIMQSTFTNHYMTDIRMRMSEDAK